MGGQITQILTSSLYIAFLALIALFGFAEEEMMNSTYLNHLEQSTDDFSRYVYKIAASVGVLGAVFWSIIAEYRKDRSKKDTHAQEMEDKDLEQAIRYEELRKLRLENDLKQKKNEDSNNSQK